jgi:hypothetical protein
VQSFSRKCAGILCAAWLSAVSEAQLASQQVEPPAIAIVLNGSTVSASGLTPGGQVIIITGWWMRPHGLGELGRRWMDGHADPTGSLTVTFSLTVPDDAFVAAIDVATGHWQTRTADPGRYRREDIPEGRFRRNGAREVDLVMLPQESAMFVLVRPGMGAWVQTAGDGAGGDADAQSNGLITGDPAQMRPIGDSPAPPSKIKNKDLFLVLDPKSGMFGVTEVGP